MTDDTQKKRKFDCVEFMRQALARITAETAGMTAEETGGVVQFQTVFRPCVGSNGRTNTQIE